MSEFERQLREYMSAFQAALVTDIGDWVVKGFIDACQNVYNISSDTKVISKLIALMLFPLLNQFARKYDYGLVLAKHQNHYPDITFVSSTGEKIAFDLKSTYRVSASRARGFTLGAFTGYFRQRDSNKNTTYPYREYSHHYVLGIIYSHSDIAVDERRVYKLAELTNIQSVAHDFVFLLCEKWKLAADRPGSGNTKNIDSENSIQALVHGEGAFAAQGEAVFDDYWMNYLTSDMARAIDSSVPYNNLNEYWEWRNR